MKKILTFGTFDMIHPGHISYLKQAKRYGDKLYVLVACDQAVMWAKGKKPQERERQRLKNVQALPFVDFAWIGKPVRKTEDYLKPIMEIKPDVVCLGYDQAIGIDDWLREKTAGMVRRPKIMRLKSFRPRVYKTSIIKKRG